MEKTVEILECTLRDGSYAVDFQFSAEDTYIICKALEEAGFSMIEIGHGYGLGASGIQFGVAAATDEEYLKSAASALRNARFGTFFIPGIGKKEHLNLARDHGMSFVRIGTNITQSNEAEEYIKYAKKLGFEVSYNAMKSYVVSPEEMAQRAKYVVDCGADVVAVVDSAGGMLPSDVKKYVEILREKIDVKIGFHGHNSFMLANANTITALESGAVVLDSTIQGIGRGGGNAQTEIMLIIYEKMGFDIGVDKYKAMDIGEELIRPKMKDECGVKDLDIIMGYAFFHSSFLKRVQNVIEEIPVNIRSLIVEVSKIDKVNPTEELIRQAARKLIEKDNEI